MKELEYDRVKIVASNQSPNCLFFDDDEKVLLN